MVREENAHPLEGFCLFQAGRGFTGDTGGRHGIRQVEEETGRGRQAGKWQAEREVEEREGSRHREARAGIRAVQAAPPPCPCPPSSRSQPFPGSTFFLLQVCKAIYKGNIYSRDMQ